MKNPGRRRPGLRVTRAARALQRLHFVGLHSLLALDDLEGDLLAFLQRLKAVTHDRPEVDEHILAALGGDEAESLGVVEPLDGAGLTVGHDSVPLYLVEGRCETDVRPTQCREP